MPPWFLLALSCFSGLRPLSRATSIKPRPILAGTWLRIPMGETCSNSLTCTWGNLWFFDNFSFACFRFLIWLGFGEPMLQVWCNLTLENSCRADTAFKNFWTSDDFGRFSVSTHIFLVHLVRISRLSWVNLRLRHHFSPIQMVHHSPSYKVRTCFCHLPFTLW